MSGEDRDFLFTSLEDLEREYAAGDMDDADYEALKSSYVKRLADVLRGADVSDELLENVDVVPVRNGRKFVLTVGVVLCVAVGLGVLVARQSGQRLPGQTLSGGTPNSTAGLLAQARQLNFSDPIAAIKIYSEYPDAHCFLGIVSYRFVADTATAKTELKKCQETNPPAEVQTFVDSIVAEVNASK